MKPSKLLHANGQMVGLEYLQRNLLNNGCLRQLVEEQGVTDVTSDPANFEKAIGDGVNNDRAVDHLGQDGNRCIERVATKDTRRASDTLTPVYECSGRVGGLGGLEVSPYLLMKTEGRIAQTRRFLQAFNPPNLKVSVTDIGLGVSSFERHTTISDLATSTAT